MLCIYIPAPPKLTPNPQGFEELYTHTNILNRKLEEVHGVGKEFGSVAALWGQFLDMVKENQVGRAPRMC